MSKINEWILEQEQNGNEIIKENNNNDAHGEDELNTMKEIGFIFDEREFLQVMFGNKK